MRQKREVVIIYVWVRYVSMPRRRIPPSVALSLLPVGVLETSLT
jgi:hypothetical protein